MIGELVRFDLSVVGWAMLHVAWQGALVGVIAWASLLPGSSPVVRERVAGLALATLVFLFALAALRAVGHALEVGPERLAPGIASPLEPITPWLGAAWLVGAAFAFLRLVAGVVASRRLRAGAKPRSGLVRETAEVTAPMLVDLFAPVILVPPGGVPASVLAHEMAHLDRGDLLWNALARSARALLWFHPVAWFLVARLDVEREFACDDIAARECGTARFARALAALEQARGRAPGLAANGAPLLARVRRLAEPAPVRSPHAALAGIALLVGLVYGVLATAQAGGPCLPASIARLHHSHPRPMLDGPWDDKRLVIRNVDKT
jgi:D-alanyl-D-alanine endopeptidase (penicillin-binding protein 7)